jgi:hypothetical protein
MTPEQIEVAARKLCVTNFYPRFIPEHTLRGEG